MNEKLNAVKVGEPLTSLEKKDLLIKFIVMFFVAVIPVTALSYFVFNNSFSTLNIILFGVIAALIFVVKIKIRYDYSRLEIGVKDYEVLVNVFKDDAELKEMSGITDSVSWAEYYAIDRLFAKRQDKERKESAKRSILNVSKTENN